VTNLYSRADHERVIKLLLATLHVTNSGDLRDVGLTYRETDTGDPVVTFTADQLALTADRYRLEVTTRPGPPASLELRLREDSW